jgi:diaminopimelate decarboxylase
MRSPLPLSLIERLLDMYGSPLYVYDGDELRRTIQHITRSIPYPQTQFHFATVTNGNVALLRIFQEAGWGLHANSPGDVYLGWQAGFLGKNMVYSGSNLNPVEMADLFDWGVSCVNLDSLSQLQLCGEVYQTGKGSQLRVGLRLNHPDMTGDSRIGVRVSEFAEAEAIARQFNFKIAGLHFYRGTGTNATAAFTQAIANVVNLAQKLSDWEYLDFGGGFGYPYRHGTVTFDWQEFGAVLSQQLDRVGRKIKLVIEPGRAAIASCGTLLTKVVSVKWQDGKQIVGVDTTVANLSVPSVHGGYREIVAFAPEPNYPTDVCGNTTYSRDYLGKKCLLPKLAVGDILAILDVGAYGYAMSSHFLHRPRPAEVLLESDRDRLIRQRENYSVLLNGQVL